MTSPGATAAADDVYAAPSPSSSSSRFEFAGDAATKDLPRLEEEARRRREDYRNRIRAIDGRIAVWTCKLAQECLDRDNANATIMDRAVHTPLERCAERTFAAFDGENEREDEDNEEEEDDDDEARTGTDDDRRATSARPNRLLTPKPVHELSASVTKIQEELLRLRHRVVFDGRDRHLLSLQRTLTERVAPQLRLECTKADKREGSLVRRFEAAAAVCERGVLEQQSLNSAEFETLERDFDESDTTDPNRESVFLEKVRAFRHMLRMESAERKRQDEIIVEKILQTQEHLQNTVLNSLAVDAVPPPPPPPPPIPRAKQ